MPDTPTEHADSREFEPSDVSVSRIVWVGLGLLGVIGLVLVVLLPYRASLRVEPGPQPEQAPLLQHPVAHARAVLIARAAPLHEYAWVDRDQGIARIPIERAIDLLLQQQAEGSGQTTNAQGGSEGP